MPSVEEYQMLVGMKEKDNELIYTRPTEVF